MSTQDELEALKAELDRARRHIATIAPSDAAWPRLRDYLRELKARIAKIDPDSSHDGGDDLL
ncbi:hypothetical protein [Rhodopila sp.]|uniref:hypothetical protein n=1 Tax=Rhodopila sp. TaxID=2480087 RepID=UPI002B7463E2|nr:hypothetical protein [Rhodopila sp.]HVZ08100.1 hypothetical protein [Rhodopila sp.]